MMHIRNFLIIFCFFLMINMISIKACSQVFLRGVGSGGGSGGMCVGGGGGSYKGTLLSPSIILSAAAIEFCVTK